MGCVEKNYLDNETWKHRWFEHNDFDQSFQWSFEKHLKENVGPVKVVIWACEDFYKWSGALTLGPKECGSRKKERNELCLDLLGMN